MFMQLKGGMRPRTRVTTDLLAAISRHMHAHHRPDFPHRGKPIFSSAPPPPFPGAQGCLVGRNGAGKTTLLRLITASSPPTGAITCEAHAAIGYVAQEAPGVTTP